MLSIPDVDGVYVYRGGNWERIVFEGPYVPSADGIYIIYFRNRSCPGCKGFDKLWNRFVAENGNGFKEAVLVQCTNFFFECSSQEAADTFIFYLVFATPQLVVVVIENGVPVYIEREVYFPDLDSLKNFVFGVNERRKRVSEESTEESEEEGIYIDLNSKNWKDVVNKIKSIVLEGRNLKEICDEEGCKVVIE